jgi:glycosyltransferase involved in cell wall biosynthesis
MSEHGIQMESKRVEWAERGWSRALLQLWWTAAAWRGKWVLMQYAAGAWSRFGVPFGALVVVSLLRFRGVRCAVMFHEPYQWEVPPSDWIDRVRGACQDWVILNLYRFAVKAIFADPLETISWLPKNHQKAVFIPIGGNIPEPVSHIQLINSKKDGAKTVAVFCLSDPPRQQSELDEITHAMRLVSADVPRLRLVLLGRGTAEAKEPIERAFKGIPVEIINLGIRSAEEVSLTLAESDAMLCVRGRLFPRRGSALAGIACGVPIVAYAGPAQNTPLAEAGVAFVPYRDRDALASALSRILTDENFQAELRSKSRWGQENYFSWNKIASRHVEALGFGKAAATAVQ